MTGLIIIIGILFFGQSLASSIRYDNYRVYRVEIEHAEHLNQLNSIKHQYDFWKSGKVGEHSDIMVPPNEIDEFEKFVEKMNSSIKIDNVQR